MQQLLFKLREDAIQLLSKLKLNSIMPYKMILNILILFLCTSCCTCADVCNYDIDAFYLRPIDKATGENALIKYEINDINDSPYDTLTGKAYLTDSFGNKINATVYQTTWYGSPPYLVVGIDDSNYADSSGVFKLWLREVYVGSFKLQTKTGKQNITACCSYTKVTNLEFVEPTIILTKKPQEEKQPFYEIQF